MNKDIDVIDIEDDDIIFDMEKDKDIIEILDDEIVEESNDKIINDNKGIEENKNTVEIQDDEIKFEEETEINTEINETNKNEEEDILNKIKQEQLDREKLLEETYKSMDNHSWNIIKLEKQAKENELIKIKYTSLEKEYIKLRNMFKIKSDDNNKLNEELTELKKQETLNKKTISMLKSLLEIIVKEYGIYDVCEITRLTEEQIKRFLQ